LLGSTRAPAQDIHATSFDQLRLLSRLGDTITVTDGSGASSTGTLVALSPSTLSLLVGRTRRDLGEQDVRRVVGRTHASLAHGAKLGFGIGAALGTLAGLALANGCSDFSCGALIPSVALTYAGFGAGVGVGIAAMIPRHPVLYDGRNAGPGPGIGMTLRF
jgi:hypothetical protein